MTNKFVFLLAALCFCAAVTFAQKTDFSGNWAFKSQQSISGKLYSNGSPKLIKAKQTDQLITLEKITAGAGGADVISSETVLIDGKAVETLTASKRKKIITLVWTADGKSFMETASLYNATDTAKLDFKITDTWSLEDGKLVLQRRNENFTNGEVWESKAFYEK